MKTKLISFFYLRSFAVVALLWGEWMRKGGCLAIRSDLWKMGCFLIISEYKAKFAWMRFFLQIAYVYPDFKTALVGTFKEGELVSAQEAEVTGSLMDYQCIQVPIFSGQFHFFFLIFFLKLTFASKCPSSQVFFFFFLFLIEIEVCIQVPIFSFQFQFPFCFFFSN